MLMPTVVTQKMDKFGLGYKPDRQERQRFLEKKRQKRIANFLGKEGKHKNGHTTTELLISLSEFH